MKERFMLTAAGAAATGFAGAANAELVDMVNGLDRWLLGYVNDFIELVPINFPIFNAADIAINVALICLIIDNISKQPSQQIRT